MPVSRLSSPMIERPLPALRRLLTFACTVAALASGADASAASSASTVAVTGASTGLARTTATAAARHDVGQSYIFFRVHPDSLIIRLEIAVADLDRALGLGWDVTAEVGLADVEAALDPILAYAAANTEVRTREGPLELEFRRFNVRFLEITDFVSLIYAIPVTEEIPETMEVTFPVMFDVDSNHRNLLVVEHNWRTATFNSEAVAGIFSPSQPTQTLDLSSSSTWRGFKGLVRLGVWHIWIGLDHILFLMALVLPSVLVLGQGRKWQPAPDFRDAFIKIVTIVTFFTLAHSVTLSMAALDVIRLPSRLVESIIAGSIAVAALHNLVPAARIKEATIAFVFGLFHGFGFASVLGDIGLGQDFLVLSLLGFNVGVELGQVAIIALVFPVLFLLRSRAIYGPFLKTASAGLIAVAMLWFFERVFDFNVPLRDLALALVGLG